MEEPLEEDREQLGHQAEAYDRRLMSDNNTESGSDEAPGFESGNPRLAKTLRLLRNVFPREPAAQSAEQDTDVLLPPEIGRFILQQRLGSGSFGSVWLARDPLLERDVALKVAHVGVHASAHLLERFQREAHLAARLHHPNIVPVFETGEDDGRVFIISEYCAGTTLATWLDDRDHSVDANSAAVIVRQLADAAEHAHQQGLIHRDIKPGNVLLSEGRCDTQPLVPRLTDFGLARDLTVEESSTRTGELLGTVKYMSPEQAQGFASTQGPATDIYSLGVLLYLLTTGKTPFDGDNDFEIIQQIVAAHPAPPHRLSAHVPLDLSSICLKCLEKQPDRRYSSAAVLRDDLDRFLRQEPTVARPIPPTERLVRWTRRAPAVAALAILLPTTLFAAVIGLSVFLQRVGQHAKDLSVALAETRRARDDATTARQAAESQREFARETSYRSDMRLAFDLWGRGRVIEVDQLLNQQTPGTGHDLRGAEWFLLNAELRAKYRELGRHDGAVTECVVSRDRRTAYSAGVDGTIRYWPIDNPTEQHVFTPGMSEVHALALSSDETLLAVGGSTEEDDRARVILLDAVTGAQHSTLQSHTTTIESIACSADGRWLAAGSRYEPVQLTRLNDGETFTLDADRRNRALSFSSDSRLLCVSASHNAGMSIWQLDGKTPQVVQQTRGRTRGHPYVAHFVPNSTMAAVSYANLEGIAIFEALSGQLQTVTSARIRSPSYSCLGLSPDAGWLVAGNDAGSLHLWGPGSLQLIAGETAWEEGSPRIDRTQSWAPHLSRVNSVAVSRNAEIITSGDDGRVVLTAPLATGASITSLPGITVMSFCLDDDMLLLGCRDGTVRELPIETLANEPASEAPTPTESRQDELPRILLQCPSAVTGLDLSPDGQFIAAATKHGGAFLHRRRDGSTVRTLIPDASNLQPDSQVALFAIGFSSTGGLVASTGQNDQLRVHDVATGRELAAATTGVGWTVCFLPGDSHVACGGGFEGLQILDISTGELQTIPSEQSTTTLQLSADDRWLMTTHRNGIVQLIDLESDSAIHRISGHRASAESAVFSANGRSVISVDLEGTIQFIDSQTDTVIGQLEFPDPQSGTYRAYRDGHWLGCNQRELLHVIGHPNEGYSTVYCWPLTSE